MAPEPVCGDRSRSLVVLGRRVCHRGTGVFFKKACGACGGLCWGAWGRSGRGLTIGLAVALAVQQRLLPTCVGNCLLTPNFSARAVVCVCMYVCVRACVVPHSLQQTWEGRG